MVDEEIVMSVMGELAYAEYKFVNSDAGGKREYCNAVIWALEDGLEIHQIGRKRLIHLLTALLPSQTDEQKVKSRLLHQFSLAKEFKDESVNPPKDISLRQAVILWHSDLQETDPATLSHIERHCRGLAAQECYEQVLKWNRNKRLF